jgi:hypothetical protein
MNNGLEQTSEIYNPKWMIGDIEDEEKEDR